MVFKILYRHVFEAYTPKGRKTDILKFLKRWYHHIPDCAYFHGDCSHSNSGVDVNVPLNFATDHTFEIDIMNYLCFVSSTQFLSQDFLSDVGFSKQVRKLRYMCVLSGRYHTSISYHIEQGGFCWSFVEAPIFSTIQTILLEKEEQS